jgi:two-component system, NtrC family, response regulator AtoC
VFPIRIPPLRDHLEDAEALADHFLEEVNRREGTEKVLTPAARKQLRAYSWPGNVRELKNVVERAAILADAEIGEELLPAGPAAGRTERSETLLQIRIGSSLEDAERRLILATLQECGGDKKRAVEMLGMSLKTLYTRLSVYEAMDSLPPRGGPSAGGSQATG